MNLIGRTVKFHTTRHHKTWIHFRLIVVLDSGHVIFFFTSSKMKRTFASLEMKLKILDCLAKDTSLFS